MLFNHIPDNPHQPEEAMKTITLPASWTAEEDIIKPLVTFAVPNDATLPQNGIHVVATLDTSSSHPVHTITRIVIASDVFYAGTVASSTLRITSALGESTDFTQLDGHRFGNFYNPADPEGPHLEYDPTTGKVRYFANGTTVLDSEESYPSVDAIATLTFKTSIGGVPDNYATGVAADPLKYCLRYAGDVREAPKPVQHDLASTTAKGISTTTSSVVIPKGTTLAHNAPAGQLVYLTF